MRFYDAGDEGRASTCGRAGAVYFRDALRSYTKASALPVPWGEGAEKSTQGREGGAESAAVILPNDIARCAGVGNDEEGWREGCETCRRQTDPGSGDHVAHMEPPAIIAFWCEFLIEP